MYGVLNFPRGASGSVWIRRTPAQTSVKAKRVPILQRSATMYMFINSTGIATTKPVTMVAKEGVLKRGWIREKDRGSSPSRLMLIQMRGWPIWNTKRTLAMATTALAAIIPDNHFRWRCSTTQDRGSRSEEHT